MVPPEGQANHSHNDTLGLTEAAVSRSVQPCSPVCSEDCDKLLPLSELCSHDTQSMVGVVSEPHLDSSRSSKIHQMGWFLQNIKW